MAEFNGADFWQTIATLLIVAWAAVWIVFKICLPGKPSGGCGSCGSCPQRARPADSPQLYQLQGDRPLK